MIDKRKMTNKKKMSLIERRLKKIRKEMKNKNCKFK